MHRFCCLIILIVFTFNLHAQSEKTDEDKWKDRLQENYDIYVRKVKYQREHLPWVDVHFGLNNWVTNDFVLNDGNAEAELLRSWAWKFGMGGKYRLSKTPLVFQFGLQFSVHRLGLSDNNALVKSENSVDIQPLEDVDMIRSQVVVSYMNIPLMVHLDFSDYGIDNGFTFGIGGEVGLRINGYQRQIFNDQFGDEMRVKSTGNYHFQTLRYGLAAQLGYGSYKLSAGYDLNPVFANGPEGRMVYLLLGIVL